MSQETNHLDNFFGDIDMSWMNVLLLSNCCDAKPYGELFKNFGRCSDCMEMAEFSTGREEKKHGN